MRNNKNNLIIIVLLFFLVSCGSQKTEDLSQVSDSMSVDWTADAQRVVPKIEDQPGPMIGYGPMPPSGFVEKNAESKDQNLQSIVLGPGGYRTLSYLSLLKELHLRGEPPHIVVGHELGAIMASYFAFGFRPDYIEWKFFKFTKEAAEEKLYSEDWLELVEKYLLDEFADKKIEEGKLTLVLPVYSKKENKVIYLKRGRLYDALMANIDLNNHRNLSMGPAFSHEIYNPQELGKWKVKHILVTDVLSCGLEWKEGNAKTNKLFQSASEKLAQLNLKNELKIEYPLQGFSLDDLGQTAELIYQSKSVSREKIFQWEKTLEEKDKE